MKSEEDLKSKLSIKARENNLAEIRTLGQRLRAVQRNSFRKRYGNLLGLLDIEVQTSLITALRNIMTHLSERSHSKTFSWCRHSKSLTRF